MKLRRRPGAAPVAGVDGNWKCSHPECGNVNFPKRTHCNRCHKERTVEQAHQAESYLKSVGAASPESGSTPASPVSVSGVNMGGLAVSGGVGVGGGASVPIPNGGLSHGHVHHGGIGVHGHSSHLHSYHTSESRSESESGSPIGSLVAISHAAGSLQSDGSILDGQGDDGNDDLHSGVHGTGAEGAGGL